jgi:hypothetical protein
MAFGYLQCVIGQYIAGHEYFMIEASGPDPFKIEPIPIVTYRFIRFFKYFAELLEHFLVPFIFIPFKVVDLIFSFPFIGNADDPSLFDDVLIRNIELITCSPRCDYIRGDFYVKE